MALVIELRRGAAWRAAGWGAAALGGVATLGLVWLASDGIGSALLATAALAGCGLGLGAILSAGRWRRAADKLSGDIDVLSTRLLRAEARLAEVQGSAQPGSRGPASEAADPALRAGLAEVTAEIGVLGGIVRDLAVTVADQDRDIAALKENADRSRAAATRAPMSAPAARPFAPPPAASGAEPVRNPVVPTLWPRAEPDAPAPSLAPRGRDVDERTARREAAIRAAFEEDRVELHLQPIVSLPQRKVRLYEALARLRLVDDTLLVPAEFLPVLEREGRAPDLDRKVLARSAAVVRHLAGRGSETLVSVNLSPASVEPAFLRGVGRLVDVHPDLAGRLVLEVSQRSWRTLEDETAAVVAQLRDRGLAFACDRTTDLRVNPLLLADRGVRYVKLPAELLLRPDASGDLDVAVKDLATILSRAGVRLVAERVEREEDIPDLIELDVPLAQGFAFAPPRAVRPEVLSGRETPPPALAPATTSDPEPPVLGDERKPFRAFLRRATPQGG